MQPVEFPLFVTYGQLAVFPPWEGAPFSLWTQGHVDQGFAWRPESVSFRTVTETGTHKVKVRVQAQEVASPVGPNCIRAVQVPYEVDDEATVEIASISESHRLSIPPGRYALRCEFFPGGGEFAGLAMFTFLPATDSEFKVLKADSVLRVPDRLLTRADPA